MNHHRHLPRIAASGRQLPGAVKAPALRRAEREFGLDRLLDVGILGALAIYAFLIFATGR